MTGSNTIADDHPAYQASKPEMQTHNSKNEPVLHESESDSDSVKQSQQAEQKKTDEVSSPSSMLDPEKVLRLWPEILLYLQKNNGRVYAFLVDGTPLKMDKGRLVVGFKAVHDLHIKKLSEEANRIVIEEAFRSVVGHPVGFIIEVIPDIKGSMSGPSTEDRIKTLLGDMADLLEIQDK